MASRGGTAPAAGGGSSSSRRGGYDDYDEEDDRRRPAAGGGRGGAAAGGTAAARAGGSASAAGGSRRGSSRDDYDDDDRYSRDDRRRSSTTAGGGDRGGARRPSDADPRAGSRAGGGSRRGYDDDYDDDRYGDRSRSTRCDRQECVEMEAELNEALTELNKMEKIEQDLADSKIKLEDAQRRVQELETENQSLRQEAVSHESTINKLKSKLDAALSELKKAQSTSSADRSNAAARAREERERKGREIELLEENTKLRADHKDAMTKVTELTRALDLLEAEKAERDNDMQVLDQALEEKEEAVRDANKASATKDKEKAELQRKIDALVATARAFERTRQDDARKIAEVEAASAAKLAEKSAAIAKLESEIQRMKNATHVATLEADLQDARAIIDNDRRQIADLQHQIEDLYMRTQQMQLAMSDVNAHTDEKVRVAIEQEQRKYRELQAKYEAANKLTEATNRRVEGVQQEKVILEKQLDEISWWKTQYEKDNNLETIARQIQLMREDIMRRDEQISHLNAQVGRQSEEYDVLYEIARRLCAETGRRPDTDLNTLYDRRELHVKIEGTVQRYELQMAELSRQVDMFQGKYLELLRERVKTAGDDQPVAAVDGLTDEQMRLVKEYIKEMGWDGANVSSSATTAGLRREIARLEQELRDARTQVLRKSVDAPVLIANAQSQAAAPAPAPAAAVAAVSAADAERQDKLLAGMQRTMNETVKRLNAENERLRRDLSDKDAQLTELASMPRGPLPEGAPASPPPRIVTSGPSEALLRDVQHQLDDAREATRRASQEVGRLTGVEQELRRELTEARASLDKSKREQRELQAKNAELTTANARLVAAVSAASTATTATQAQVVVAGSAVSAGSTGAGPQTASSGHHTAMTVVVPHAAHDQRPSNLPPRNATPRLSTVPMSPAGRLQHQATVSALSLPPEAWAEEVKSIYAQYFACLEELTKKDEQLRIMELSVQETDAQLATMNTQLTMLYRDHFQAQQAWKTERDQLKTAADEATAREAQLKAKAGRYDEMMAATKPGATDDQLRAEILRLSKLLAEHEMVQPLLARRFNLATEEARLARKELQRNDRSFVEMEATLKRRVLYLELWKKGAEARLARLADVSESWVPQDDYKRVSAELEAVQKRYHQMLATETALRSEFVKVRSAPRQLQILQGQLEIAKTDLDRATRDIRVLETEVTELRKLQTPAGAAAAAAAATGPSVQELMHQCAEARADAARAVSLHENSEKRVVALNKLVEELRASADTNVARAHQAEDTLAAVRRDLEASEAAAAELRKKLVDVVTKEEATKLKERVKQLEELYQGMSREAYRLREMADIASSQAAVFASMHRAQDDQQEYLRDQLRALTSRTDDDAIIGKLQHQLMHMKTQYHAFGRKHEATRGALEKARLQVATLEVGLDQHSGKLLEQREAARAREVAQDRVLRQLLAETRGGVSVQQMQQVSEKLAELEALTESQAKDLDAAVASKVAAETELAVCKAETAIIKRQVQEMQKSVPADINAFIVKLQDEQLSSALQASRFKRELDVLRDDFRNLKTRADADERRIRELEKRAITAEFALRDREELFRQQLLAVKQQKPGTPTPDVILQQVMVTSARPTSAGVPAGGATAVDSSFSGSATANAELQDAYQKAIRRQEDSDATILKLTKQLGELEQAGRVQAGEIERLRNLAAARKKRATYLERAMAAEGIDTVSMLRDGGVPDDPNSGDEAVDADMQVVQAKRQLSAQAQLYRDEQERLQRAAQETIDSLTALVGRKNAVIASYQAKLKAVREELEAERASEVANRQKMLERATSDAQQTIDRLRATVRELTEQTPRETAAGAMQQHLLERVDDLEQRLIDKERIMTGLEAELEDSRRAVSRAEQRMGDALRAAEATAQENADLKAQLQSQQNPERIVATLKAHLRAKDKKLQELKKSLDALKEQFVKEAAEHARAFETQRAHSAAVAAGAAAAAPASGDGAASASSSANMGPIERMQFEKQFGQLRGQARQLQERLRATNATLQETQAREDAATKAQAALRDQIDKLARDATEHQNSARRAEERCIVLERQIQKLKTTTTRRDETGITTVTVSNGDQTDHAAQVRVLQKRIDVLVAQVEAYRAEAKQREAQLQQRESDLRQKEVELKVAVARAETARVPALPAGTLGSGAQTTSTTTVTKIPQPLTDHKRAAELQTLRDRVAGLESQIGKLNEENSKLRAKVEQQQKQIQSANNASAAAVSSAAAVEQLRRQIFELEEAKADLELRLHETQSSRIQRLEADLAGVRVQLQAAKESEQEALQRVVKLQALVNNPGGTSEDVRLRMSEDRFVNEYALRQQLSAARERVSVLETEMLSLNATLLDQKFEAEQRGQEVERLRRRLEELGSVQQVFSGAEAATGKGRPQTAGPASKASGAAVGGASAGRVQELEDLTAALTKINEKQRAELERLRKRASSATTTDAGKLKAAREDAARLGHELDEAKAELSVLTKKLARFSELQSRVTQLETELRDRDLQLQTLRNTGVNAGTSVSNVGRTAAAAPPPPAPRSEAGGESRQVLALQQQLAQSESKLLELSRRIREQDDQIIALQRRQGGAAAGAAGDMSALQARIAELTSENAVMREELSHFDLQFFEEVEDLKYRYQEAAKKCAAFDEHMRRCPTGVRV